MRKRQKFCGLLLLCKTLTHGNDTVNTLDPMLEAKVEETQRALVDVDQQLSAAQHVVNLLAMEDTQLQLLTMETRTKLAFVQEEVARNMKTAMMEVDRMQKKAMENVVTWKETLQSLEEATQRNEQTLQMIQDKKKQQLLVDLELQKDLTREDKKELEILEELEWQRELEENLEEGGPERLQEVEQQEMEKQPHRQHYEEARKLDLGKQQKERKAVYADLADSDKAENLENARLAKRFLDWYVVKEQTALNAALVVFQQLVLPVVGILGLFFFLTIVIAIYKTTKDARRNQRVLYSGYPRSYRPKVRQQPTSASADEPALRRRRESSKI